MKPMLRALVCAATLIPALAIAGEKYLKNDGFTGNGTVNTAVSFPEYHGAAVLLTPDPGDYPLTLIGIDVLAVTYNMGAGGIPVPFNLDLWDSSGGTLNPPRAFDGGVYTPRIQQASYQFSTSTSQFNRIMLSPPIVLDAGQIFISLGTVFATSDSDGTIAVDTSPQKAGGNWWRNTVGYFTPLDLPDGGYFQGVNHNWIIRGVLSVPDLPLSVISITPGQGSTAGETPVVISGSGFEFGAQAFVGNTGLLIDAVSPPNSIQARVPPGMAPGVYDVTVRNTGGASGVLTQGYRVLNVDGGQGGGAGGGAGGGSGGGSGGGGMLGDLVLDSISPADAYAEDTTLVVLLGDGFADGAQVLIGPTVLTEVTVKSGAVINASVPPGLPTGLYDVKVVNLDGMTATLHDGFTVKAGSRTKGACGCGSASAVPLLGLALLVLRRRRNANT